jgi:hypothetical protein
MQRLILMAGVLALVGCVTPAPTGVTDPANFPGTWSGPITGASASGTLTLTDTQQVFLVLTEPGIGDQLQLGGTWSTSFANAVSDESGAFAGSAFTEESASVSLVLSASAACELVLLGTRPDSLSMTGTYTTSGCAVPDSGTFVLTKQ